MSDDSADLAAIGRLEPKQIVALLTRLKADDERIAELNIDEVATAVDPRKLSRSDFVQLVSELDRLAAAGAELDLSAMNADNFARLISRASKAQVDGLMARPELRARILGEVFRRMNAHYRPERAGGRTSVVHWRLPGGGDDDGYDRYETVLDPSGCTVHTERTADPRVTVTVQPADFLKLITRNASAPMLFMTGKLKVRGDLAFAAGMIGLFDLPKP